MNRIPETFELAGQTITVKFVKDLLNTADAHGAALYRENVIQIQEPTDSCYLPDDKLKQIFLHEVTHWILFQMGHQQLNQDETFVEIFSGYLYQVLKTAQGGIDGGRNLREPIGDTTEDSFSDPRVVQHNRFQPGITVTSPSPYTGGSVPDPLGNFRPL